MSYQVLARKWRPKTFQELVGQEHVVRALSNALTQQRLHHAYLFTGTRGVGKTTLARILAKALNCETGITATPCGQCAACTEIDRGRFVDLLELDAASNTGIDNMREVLENAQYAPTSARFKVYIIDEVHMLSKPAFNAMLKTLEEPPDHVKFILATTDPQKVPVTVLSRCLQFNLRQMPVATIHTHLQDVIGKESLNAEPAALLHLAHAACGSMRDALSLLDQAIAYGDGQVRESEVRAMLGSIDHGVLFTLLEALLRSDGPALVATARSMEEYNLDCDTALDDLALLLHRIALAQTAPDALPEELPERARILALSGQMSPEDAQLYYQIAVLGRRDLDLAPDAYAGLVMCLLRMLAFAPVERLAPAAPSPRPAKTQEPAPAPEIAVPLPESESKKPGKPATPAPDSPVAARFDGDWPGLVSRLGLSGMARMLAQHCALVGFDGEKSLQLEVPPQQKHLMEPAYQDKLCTALKMHFGPALHVNIALGGSPDNTPAEKSRKAKADRQTEAEQSIHNDPFVRDLMDGLGATIVPSSIKPAQ